MRLNGSYTKKGKIIMDIITTILILGIAANGLAGATLILAGPIYAWNDRWLDRTHRTTTDENRE